MSLRIVRLLNLVFVMADFGLMFAHVLEIPGKLRFTGPQWLTVQQNLYIGFGTFGAAAEVLAVATTWLLVYLARSRRPAFALTLSAAILMMVSFLTWFVFIDPINAVIAASTPETLPAQWTELRNRWETWHAIRAALSFTALDLLLWAILAETHQRGEIGR